MISVDDLKEAIAECEGERRPNSSTCIRLMAYYYLLEQYTGTSYEMPMYSTQSEPAKVEKIEIVIGDYGDSEFLELIKGKPAKSVWTVISELMDTIAVVKKPIYDSVIRELNVI